MKNNFPVLIVEDNPASRKLLEKFLVKAGYSVTSVDNGRKALEMFREKFFPFIITDWKMPEMDGLELCNTIRESVFSGYVYIILLTGMDSRDDVITGLEAGVDDYLTKPFNQAELIARLSTGTRILELEKSLKKANEEIKQLSVTDSLTGCYNRGYIIEHLPREIAKAKRYRRPLSLILCDIDHFKRVNDTCGHQTGDRVLQEFVRWITESIRSDVDWLARYGGEEFLVVLPETDVAETNILAERLRGVTAQRVIETEGKEIHLTASFGVTGYDPNLHEGTILPDALIAKADTLLYRAKHEGRNRVKAEELQRNKLNQKEVMA